jgi:hypothetical protein
MCIARRIWLRRNGVIHDGVFLHPNRVVLQATQAVERYQQIMVEKDSKPAVNEEAKPSHWKAPPPSCLKAN